MSDGDGARMFEIGVCYEAPFTPPRATERIACADEESSTSAVGQEIMARATTGHRRGEGGGDEWARVEESVSWIRVRRGNNESTRRGRGLLQAERATLITGKGRAAITATAMGLGAR